ncbi:hypothetical protein ISF_08666 [Cordyceps fumosorosea ARSEF 2679]|uniref:Uncharacterized protein n=1 Tax=Cordyceps fumosorosea (strain ARSEF 2679) TaxID=1081104 RepID=A0A167LZK3_CORFA|nr:hypothetical protein ISF_08666 [Cordyceps fumosorosea ARSEF 2679]OAA53727.1 hypothetical protein ISF_08666 [Cordyceps fumosorosea ARSEF 2679]
MAAILAVPDYRLWRWECCEANPDSVDEKVPWFNLYLGMPKGRFKLTVNRANFNKSPDKLAEFDSTLSYLRSRSSCSSIDLVATGDGGVSPNKSVAWIIPSLVDRIRELESANELPPSQESLHEFWARPWTVFSVMAEQDCLVLEGGTTLVDTYPPSMAFCTGYGMISHGHITRKTLRILGATDLMIRARDEGRVVADEPRVGFLTERAADLLKFKPRDESRIDYPMGIRSFAGLALPVLQNIVEKHEFVNQLPACPNVPSRLASTDQMRVLRAHFILADGMTTQWSVHGMCGTIGLAMEHLGRGTTTLREALEPGLASVERRKLWKKHLMRTMSMMHVRGVVWADVSLDSVLVREDSAWIYRLGPGYLGEMLGDVNAQGVRNGGSGPRVHALRERQRQEQRVQLMVQKRAKQIDIRALSALFSHPLWGSVTVSLAELQEEMKREAAGE